MKRKKAYVIVNAIQCLECGAIIYSRALHDYHLCPCGACTIDGGFDYLKVNATKLYRIIHLKKRVYATPNKLFRDWVDREDAYGLIKSKKAWLAPPPKKTWKETIAYWIKQILSLGKF